MASTYGDILTAVKTLVSAISGLTTANQVVIRKRLAYVRNVDTVFPFVCIAPTVERLADTDFTNEDHVDYPVHIERRCLRKAIGLRIVIFAV